MKILFITATRIGDAVLSTGVLSWLAKQHPDARFTVACGRPAAPLFQPFPQLDRVLVMDKRPFAGHWIKLWTECVGQYWNLVVDLRGSAIAYQLLAGRRIRWRNDSSGHQVASLGALFGLEPPPPPMLWIGPEQERRADAVLPPGAPVLGIGPTANWRGKEWPADRFIGLIERLTGPSGIMPGARVALFGARDEREAAKPVLRSIPESRRSDVLGTAELPVVAACLRRCTLYIGNDSGLMHMAAAVGTKTLGLFGPGNEARYAPWGAHTAVVRTKLTPVELMGHAGFDHRNTGTLMESLAIDDVVAAADELHRRNLRDGDTG